MSQEQLRRAATGATPGTAVTAHKPGSLPALIEKMKPQLALALPKHMNADRMVRIALTELRKNPKLMNADPQSVLASVVIGSQLGLEPGINGQAYLIPYDDRRKNITICTFVPGWKGLVDLAQRSGRASVWTGAVHTGDVFDYEYGTKPYLKHKPGDVSDPKQLTHVYACGWVKGAEYPVVEVWSMAKVYAHRDRFNKVGTRHYSYDHPEMYGRKVALLQVLKYMPQSIELSTAMDLEHAADDGRQALDLTDAMDGTFVPVGDDPAEGAGEGGGGEEGTPIDESTAIERFKAAKTQADIDAVWAEITSSYKGQPVPVPLEAARNTYRDILKEKAGSK